jgi:light-regulated signal transduction histidine kinase (bacteriophytochrome)
MTANTSVIAPGLPDVARLQDEIHRLANELSQVKSELQRMSFTVMHDLRAPLRHIGAFAKIIEEDHGPQLDAAVLGHLKIIKDAAEKAMRMMDELSAPTTD